MQWVGLSSFPTATCALLVLFDLRRSRALVNVLMAGQRTAVGGPIVRDGSCAVRGYHV